MTARVLIARVFGEHSNTTKSNRGKVRLFLLFSQPKIPLTLVHLLAVPLSQIRKCHNRHTAISKNMHHPCLLH